MTIKKNVYLSFKTKKKNKQKKFHFRSNSFSRSFIHSLSRSLSHTHTLEIWNEIFVEKEKNNSEVIEYMDID